VTLSLNALGKGAAALAVVTAFAGEALAQQAQTPSISGNSWVAIAIVGGLVLLIFLLIGGALSLSKRDKSDAEDTGIAIIGPDEDDDK